MTGRLLAIAFALGLAVSSFCIGRASSGATFDAALWRKLTYDQQGYYVLGLLNGYSQGFDRGFQIADQTFTGVILEAANHAFTDNPASRKAFFLAMADAWERRATLAKANRFPPPELAKPTFPDTFKTYIDGITNFYDNNPGSADWSPAGVMECLSTNPPKSCNAPR